MKTLYFDCSMGAAGDMLTAALLELLPDQESFLAELNGLGLPGVGVKKESSTKGGIKGTQVIVTVDGQAESAGDMREDEDDHGYDQGLEQEHTHDHEHERMAKAGDTHHHIGMDEIEHIIMNLKLSPKVKTDVLAVYALIAEAESHVHGVPISDIHFHEVGTMDALADITAVCLLMEKIAPEQVIVSPVHVGSGHVRCAHGILPVPAPATAHILRGVPIYGGRIKGELCTPTGAALLKHFATSFGEMPPIKIKAIGYGMGKKDFAAANCVRVFLGETEGKRDQVFALYCNVDDMTAEEIGFAIDRLFAAGALEVFTVPAGMKKSRPGTLIHILCRDQDREKIVSTIFKYTTTIGIREVVCNRYVLERSFTTLQTPYGKVRRKDSVGYGVRRSKYEYDDISRIAKEKGINISEVIRLLEEVETGL
ncbi:MAG TPA: nickel pincer cofactor biosynthesis protein LarC [Hydrogenispora sp.]|nr:nickel pincer cofactor biosynthesis protein LarC [Hydrogenispora sp.]